MLLEHSNQLCLFIEGNGKFRNMSAEVGTQSPEKHFRIMTL